MGQSNVINWLSEHSDPWVRYRANIDLPGKAKDDKDVRQIFSELIEHPQLEFLLEAVAEWPQPVQMKKAYNPNDTIWQIQTLADFGLDR